MLHMEAAWNILRVLRAMEGLASTPQPLSNGGATTVPKPVFGELNHAP